MFQTLAMGLCPLLFVLPSLSFAQQDRVVIDQSRIPLEASSMNDFVPPGWTIEEQVSGDLTRDALPDCALKLIEDKPATKDDTPVERQRALVIVLRNREGTFSRAAVADKLLQCTTCGGAFYGGVEAPAHVKIEKSVLIVNQDHGSREVTSLIYRFRYEPDTKKFVLIGFDFVSHDRATAEVVSESTNYLTGVRIITRGKGKRGKTVKTRVSKERIDIEQVDSEQYEAAAAERLHL